MPSNAAVLAGFWVRLAAVLYDCMVLTATLIVAAFPVVLLAGGPPQSWAARLGFQLYLLTIVCAFFGWFWVRGGQTIGMRAWRLRVVTATGAPLGWREAALRLAAAALSWAALGAGFLWALFDPEGLTWHDRLSGTRLVRLPKQGSAGTPKQK
jgi:uncharacterized RDD family membrane protein YckC